MYRRIATFLVAGMALALGACTTWPKVTEDSQPLADRVARMRQGPSPSASIDFPREATKAKAE
jgi:starvation-inducible outer membrane lipoprotein